MSVCFKNDSYGEFWVGLPFTKLSVVQDRFKIIGFLGLIPKTSSYGDRFIFHLTCELNAKGKVFTFFTMSHIVGIKLCEERY